jgi:serine acetyltransferase
MKIGSNTLVGLGALVINNIPDNEVWLGVPAKKIKDNK